MQKESTIYIRRSVELEEVEDRFKDLEEQEQKQEQEQEKYNESQLKQIKEQNKQIKEMKRELKYKDDLIKLLDKEVKCSVIVNYTFEEFNRYWSSEDKDNLDSVIIIKNDNDSLYGYKIKFIKDNIINK